jgi:hypothetical protein
MNRSLIILLGLLLGLLCVLVFSGCSINPTYTVRVINDSRTNINARIEHRPKFESEIVLASAVIQTEEERTLGPVESPPLERVVLLISATGNSISAPEHHVLKRGAYTVRISDGSSTSWSPYDISVSKD